MNTDKISAKLLAAEYASNTSRKVIALKKLDNKAKQPAVILAYIFGITGTLMFGTGIGLLTLYFVMPSSMRMFLGVLFLVVGLFAIFFNCSLFKKILKKAKRRYAFEIVELAKEICEDDIF